MNDFRSFIYSILRCDYGWNKVIPDGLDFEMIDQSIKTVYDLGCRSKATQYAVAKDIAIKIKHAGGVKYFSKRIDGKPNNLCV